MAKLKVITMRDVKTEQVQWLWKPYIPLGKITILQGDGGEGKTTMSTAIAAAVSTGKSLPGGGCTDPADVIIQNAEDSVSDTTKPRLDQFGADVDRIHFIDEEEEALSLSDERIEQIITRKNAKLCILDPIQAYLGGANMNSADSVRPLMKHLGAVAARTGCAILLVGHLGKKGGKTQYRGLGSIDIYAAARSVLAVGKIETNENMRVVAHVKSNLAPVGRPQAFVLDPVYGFNWCGEYDISVDEVLGGKQKKENQFAKARRFIENTLRGGAVLADEMFEMAEEQGISQKTLYRAKSSLGVISIKHGDQWYWEIPIDVKFTECCEDSQGGQDGHAPVVTTLTIFKESEVA